MKDESYGLITFESPHAAIAAQKVLKEFDFIVMPTLRVITASCGISLKMDINQVEEAENLLEKGKIPLEMFCIYEISVNNGSILFKKLKK